MLQDYLPQSVDHFRLVDGEGRVRAYAESREDFGPIPSGWKIEHHLPGIALGRATEIRC